MYRKFFACLTLCGICSAAHAQQPAPGYAVQPFAGPAGQVPAALANQAPVQAPTGFASPVPNSGAYAIGAPATLGYSGPVSVTNQQPYPIVPSTIVHPMPVAPGTGPISSVAAQPTASVVSTWVQAAPYLQPQVTRQQQIYTPTYYYYYYQQPYQVTQMTPVYSAPAMPTPYGYGNFDPYGVSPVNGNNGGGYSAASSFGPMMNARGEMGHIRLPYYSYRRPWYYPGQPSFNVTIPGPVW